MSDLIPFTYGDRPVRTVLVDGEPWFVAADACAVLGIVNGRDAVARLTPDDVGSTDVIDTMGRRQVARTVNESGLYDLILDSRKPEAKAFRRWVTAEVLPAIRKAGTYAAQPALPRTYAEALRELAGEVEARELAEAKVAELEPAAQSWTTLADAGGDYSLRDAAQILDRDPTISTGQNRLSRHLRDIEWTDASGQPYQRQVDAGRLTRRATGGYTTSTGGHVATWQPRITIKGLHELHRLLGGTGSLPADTAVVLAASPTAMASR